MTEQEGAKRPDWSICDTDGCIGVRRDGQEDCLAHLPLETRKAILAALKPGADLDLRGTPIDFELLRELLAAMQPEDGGPPMLGRTQFDMAQFTGRAWFAGTHFSGFASFSRAHFRNVATFNHVQFTERADFTGTQFSGEALFLSTHFVGGASFGRDALGGTQFDRDVWFGRAQFDGGAGFNGARFSGRARFGGSRFKGNTRFSWAQFDENADFEETQFDGDASFDQSQFSGDAEFSRAEFSEYADFRRVQFKRAGTLGPLFARSGLYLDHAIFEQDTVIEAVGSALVCTGTRFAGTAVLRLRHTEVVLDDVVFSKLSTILFPLDPFRHDDDSADWDVLSFDEGPLARAAGGRSPRPRLRSLRGVDTALLTLSDLDLAACLFQGTHHLDQLRIEGGRPFADTPGPWRLHLGPWWVPVWLRWSRRQTLAEEHHLRRERPSPAVPGRWSRLAQPDWHGPACMTPSLVEKSTGQKVQVLMPNQLALLYRALRKAQEDSKNEPGAADFYYGEMEMRRRDAHTPWAERLILWLYWLVAGYRLRGLRSLTCLLALVVGLAGLLQAIGFNGGDPTFRDALIYATQSTISISSGNKALTEHVSWAGEIMRIALRLAGPVLLGLSLLSVRNRVKR